MNHFYPAEYGFLFEEESDFVPGIGEMITILAPGEEFLKQREALGLTQQQVADKAGILIRQYQRLESGERSLDSTSFRIGLNICHALQIDPRFYCQARIKEEGQRVHEQRPRNLMRHRKRNLIMKRPAGSSSMSPIVRPKMAIQAKS